MYIENYFEYNRNKTTEVKIGNIPLGGNNPVRLQTMTDTDTNDVEATVNQIEKIVKAGADYVRITVQTTRVAQKLKEIKKRLKEKGYEIPIIADIHFSPKAAEVAAEIVEKIRINPGNYVDLKQFKHIEYTDKEYNAEVEKLKINFIPLLNICKKHNTALRIGTNHGSLSDRILSRYGDTPKGMTEATMEFLRICKRENFNNVVISMKASNPLVMIYANRLLVKTMKEEGMNFPLHLGVTEAGNETEGRIKSATGTASLLVDGIGDTVRVSLTEPPEKEIPVAKQITEIFNEKTLKKFTPPFEFTDVEKNFYEYDRRKSKKIGKTGGDNLPEVIIGIPVLNEKSLKECGYFIEEKTGKIDKSEISADFICAESIKINYEADNLNIISTRKNKKHTYNITDYKNITENEKPDFVNIKSSELKQISFEKLKKLTDSVFVLDFTGCISPVHSGRAFFMKLKEHEIKNPVIFKYNFNEINEKTILKISGETGALFADGFGDGIWINTTEKNIKKATELCFGILQAVRIRISKTEYISCPGCGRTLFDLKKTTAEIKEKTSHLKGIKIAVMGCIVNGLGEMADADYGYVGTGSGKITLFKNKEVVKRNIPEDKATEELLKLIEQNL